MPHNSRCDEIPGAMQCNDDFIYEKAAIEEWLMSRRKTSPMTNLPMVHGKMEYQIEFRIQSFTI